MSKRVVVTGIGIISSYGYNKETFLNNLLSKKTFISKIPNEYRKYYNFKSKFYVESPDINLSEHDFPNLYNNTISNQTKMALLGTKNALLDAGFTLNREKNKYEINGFSKDSIIIIGTGFTNLETVFKSFESHTKINDKIFNRMCVPLLMPNAISSWISILFNVNGSNFTLNASCASGTYAIGQAFEKIKYQDYNMAITGGTECLRDSSGATMRTFDNLDVLTKSEDGFPRPFSGDRSGFLYNEGASCILILEELDHAIKRNANIYAEIINFVSNSDSYNIVQIDKSGKQIKNLFSGIDYKDVDYINMHGTGTILNDEVEKNIIIELFGKKENQPV